MVGMAGSNGDARVKRGMAIGDGPRWRQAGQRQAGRAQRTVAAVRNSAVRRLQRVVLRAVDPAACGDGHRRAIRRRAARAAGTGAHAC
jgi:hypothetical protein